MTIDTWYWVVVSALFGLIGGSFAGARVWRLRWKQLQYDKSEGEPYDKSEYGRLKVLNKSADSGHDRSLCLSCGHKLAWYDMIPVASWLSTRGRCRYCSKAIGRFEIIIEIGMMLAFVLSYLLWPYELTSYATVMMLVVWMFGLVVAGTLFAYDHKWSLLPDSATYYLVGLGVIYAVLSVAIGETSILSIVQSIALFTGVYAGLYYFSRWRYGEDNTWVGFGDVKLSVALALFLGSWQLSFLAIFIANLLGTLLVLPSLIRRSISRKARIPFGPLLLIGTFVALLGGGAVIDWYLGMFTL